MVVTSRIESYTLKYRSDLYVSDCPTCGIVFAIPNEMKDRRCKDGKQFYCPNGHTMSWHETEEDRQRKAAERAERQLAAERARRDQAEAEAADERLRTAAARGEVNRTRARLAGGACPCCNRTFTNLARHMSGQHPDYIGFAEVPGDFRWWNRVAAVVEIVERAGEPLTVAQVLGRLVLAGRSDDTEPKVRNALYNAERGGALRRTAPATWAIA